MSFRLPSPSFALVLVLILVGSNIALVSAGQTQYNLKVDGGIDTPDKVITVEGNSFSVSETVRVQPGEPITVHTEGSNDGFYRVNVRNSEQQLWDYRNTLSGEETFQVSTEGMTPGSYVISLLDTNGNVVEIQPVVVSGYNVAVSVSDSVAISSDTTVTVSLEQNQNAPQLDSVDVAVDNGDSTKTLTATRVGDGTYRATTSFDESGEYHVFATARGTKTYNGQKELLGLSDVHTVSVTANSQSGTTPTQSSSSSSTSTPTQTTVTSTASTTTTVSGSSPESTTNAPTAVQTTDVAVSDEKTETDQPEETPGQVTTTTGELQGIQLVLVLLLVIGAVHRVRRR